MYAKYLRILTCAVAFWGMLLLPFSAFSREFMERQLWECEGRPGETVMVLINKVENDPRLGPIFHISVSGAKLKNPRTVSGFQESLPHFPVSEETMEMSCSKLVKTTEVNPEYISGYNQWKKAFDQGKAGIFTISIGDIIGVVENTLNK